MSCCYFMSPCNSIPPSLPPLPLSTCRIYNAGGIPVRDTLDASSSVPWLDEYMGIKTKMSIQMAMSNSPNKGLRKLGCRTARNRKNPWKDREREIWKNRHNCRVVNKPEVQLVEKTEEEKAKGVEVTHQEGCFCCQQ